MNWYVYIVQCADNSLYTGITTNLARRLQEHNQSRKGAKATRSKRPVHLMYSQQHATRSFALRREAEIKSLTREQKLRIIEIGTN